MPQPIYALVPWNGSTRGTLKFGGKPLPLIGTTMSYVDLNDGVNWFTENIRIDHKKVHTFKPLVFTEESIWLGEDSEPKHIIVTARYDETNGISFPTAKALLSQAGEQYLTTDTLTGVSCKLLTMGSPQLIAGGAPPFVFKTDMEFLAAVPWANDISATTVTGIAVAGSSGAGTTTNTNITYAGSVRAKPVFTITIPVGNTVTISQIKLQNTTTGRVLTINFSPVLPANTAIVLTIDTGAATIKNGAGGFYNPIGSFPLIAPPVGTVNTYALTIVSSAATTGITMGYSFFNRWEF
jgi:hypothetical protein